MRRAEAPTPIRYVQWLCDAGMFAREALGFNADEQQARLLRDSPRRCALNCTRQWGKSTVTAAKAIHKASFYANSLTLALSPSARQSAEFLRKASGFLRALGIKPRGDGDNEMSLLLPNGSRVVGLPGSESTIRGFSSVSLLIIDEAARTPDDLYRAVRPMLAVGDGELWLLSTPNGKRGFFYETWGNGDRDWTRISAPATECPRIGGKFLESERAALGERWFRQEYLCEFVDADDTVFATEFVEGALTDEVTPLRL